MSQTPDAQQPHERNRGRLSRLFGKGRKQPEAEAWRGPYVQDGVLRCSPGCEGHPVAAMAPVPPALLGLLQTSGRSSAPPKREWSPMFADEVNAGDLVGVPAGMFGVSERELKVHKVRKHPGNSEDPLAPFFTLLMVDTSSGEVFSPTVSAHQGFRVAPAVPDSPAFLGGGV